MGFSVRKATKNDIPAILGLIQVCISIVQYKTCIVELVENKSVSIKSIKCVRYLRLLLRFDVISNNKRKSFVCLSLKLIF